MSLRAQLARGYLALPMLVALAVLAWQARAHEVVSGATAHASVRVVVLAPAVEPGHAICRLGPTGLRLAMAPADLQPQARRRDATCRA